MRAGFSPAATTPYGCALVSFPGFTQHSPASHTVTCRMAKVDPDGSVLRPNTSGFQGSREDRPMTAQADDHQRTMAYAEIALGQIKALRLPAIPRNY